MFATVLIGIDGHRGGRDAFALARRLAAPGAQLTLAHIWSAVDGIAAVATGAPHPATAARELLEELSLAADVDCRTVVRPATSPGAGLHRLAEELDADLIVVGVSRWAGAGRLLLDDETRAALHGAPCAVAVAVAGEADRGGPIRTVGVGYEPTDAGRAALVTARDLAAGLDADLHAMQVVSAVPGAVSWIGAPTVNVEGLEQQSVQRAEAVREQLQGLGGLTAHVGRGVTVRQLAHFTTEVDLLVVGSRGFGPAGRMLMGDTAGKLARVGHSSLIVTPRPAAPAPPEAAARSVGEPAARA